MENATQLIEKLDSLIKGSSSILLVCHTGADPDALASLIAMQKILSLHYKKEVVTALGERIPKSLSFIPGYSSVVNGSILEFLEKRTPDLFICLDFSQLHMSSKFDAKKIEDFIKKAGIPFVVIDHHPETYKNLDADIYLNLDPTSTSTNLHVIFHEHLGFSILPEIADSLLFGIIADTNRFKYKYGVKSENRILRIAAELSTYSTVSIEEISNALGRMDLGMLKISSAFIENIKFVSDTFAYTSLSEEDIAAKNLDTAKLGGAGQYVANDIISMINTAQRGFIVYPLFVEENTYTVRFRSCNEKFPVNEFAKALGGGGHAQSAAARVKAKNIEEAVEKVLGVLGIEPRTTAL